MLREFLYVDVDKVRSLVAQLEGGVPEEDRVTGKDQGKLTLGLRNLASRDRDWSSEQSVQRSLADAVFPVLESALETEGLLTDLSDELRHEPYWTSTLKTEHPPGSFVRVTASTRLFDVRYLARSLAGMSAALNGFLGMFPEHATPPVKSAKGTKSSSAARRREPPLEPAELEDSIGDFPIQRCSAT